MRSLQHLTLNIHNLRIFYSFNFTNFFCFFFLHCILNKYFHNPLCTNIPHPRLPSPRGDYDFSICRRWLHLKREKSQWTQGVTPWPERGNSCNVFLPRSSKQEPGHTMCMTPGPPVPPPYYCQSLLIAHILEIWGEEFSLIDPIMVIASRHKMWRKFPLYRSYFFGAESTQQMAAMCTRSYPVRYKHLV